MVKAIIYCAQEFLIRCQFYTVNMRNKITLSNTSSHSFVENALCNSINAAIFS